MYTIVHGGLKVSLKSSYFHRGKVDRFIRIHCFFLPKEAATPRTHRKHFFKTKKKEKRVSKDSPPFPSSPWKGRRTSYKKDTELKKIKTFFFFFCVRVKKYLKNEFLSSFKIDWRRVQFFCLRFFLRSTRVQRGRPWICFEMTHPTCWRNHRRISCLSSQPTLFGVVKGRLSAAA